MAKIKGQKVLAGGCFDIIHIGHIHFLKKARKLGDSLIVALESDENIKRIKGIKRPIHNQTQRKEILESLSFVDEVIILKDKMTDKDYEEMVVKIKPQIIAITKGDPMKKKKEKHAKKANSKIVEIAKIKVPSTTEILKLLDIQ